MADREMIAATLAAAFIKPLDLSQQPNPLPAELAAQIFGHAAMHAVDLYQFILAELSNRQAS